MKQKLSILDVSGNYMVMGNDSMIMPPGRIAIIVKK